MGTNKMRDISREQFEAKFQVPAGVAWKESIGMYEVVDIWKLDQAITIGKYNWLWEGWQASREAVVVGLPQVVAYEAGYDSLRDNEYAALPDRLPDFDYDELFELHRSDEVRAAIEAQGLKVKP